MKVELVLKIERKIEKVELTDLKDLNRKRDEWCREYGLQNKTYQIYYKLPSSGQQVGEQYGKRPPAVYSNTNWNELYNQ